MAGKWQENGYLCLQARKIDDANLTNSKAKSYNESGKRDCTRRTKQIAGNSEMLPGILNFSLYATSCNAIILVLTNLPDPLPVLQKDAHRRSSIATAMEAEDTRVS
jgi:hypothetical protein